MITAQTEEVWGYQYLIRRYSDTYWWPREGVLYNSREAATAAAYQYMKDNGTQEVRLVWTERTMKFIALPSLIDPEAEK